MGRKLTTILAMDAVGYSRLMEIDEAGTLDILKAIRSSIAGPAIARHSGRTVKLMGDGTLVEFSSVVDALQCAVDIQRELATSKCSVGGKHRLQLRIGLHLGDVIVEGSDIYGDGVNVAVRLQKHRGTKWNCTVQAGVRSHRHQSTGSVRPAGRTVGQEHQPAHPGLSRRPRLRRDFIPGNPVR